MRALALAAVAALALAGCGGDAPAATEDSTSAPPAEASGPLSVTVNGEPQAMDLDICSTENAYGEEEARQMSAVGPGGFPSFSFMLLPPDTLSAEYTDPDGAASYRSNDPNDFNVTVTDGGATGTVTMGSSSGQDPDVTIEFSFTCPMASADDGSGDDGSADDGSDDGAAAPASKTGFVEWNGARSELDDGDFDPQAGTGLCETQDVTGLEEGDYYRIVTKLDDGTDFSLTSRDGLVLGDTFNPIEATVTDLTQDGRTVSGSADTANGPMEFSFTC